MAQHTVYEIFDSIDTEIVFDTEDLEEAEEYHERGYIVHEHRIDLIPITRKTYMTIDVTNKWGIEH
jgi:hypothetical protein